MIHTVTYCDNCSAKESVWRRDPGRRERDGHEFVNKTLEEKGWIVGEYHLCPSCAKTKVVKILDNDE